MRKLLLLLALVALVALSPAAMAQTVQILDRSGFASRITGATVQVSQDNSTWITVGTISTAPTDGTFTTYALSQEIKSYKFVRINGGSLVNLDVSEIKFFGADGVLLTGTPVGSIGYGNIATYGPAAAFDGNASTFSSFDNTTAANSLPLVVGLDRTAQLASVTDTASPSSVSAGVAGQSLTITSTAANFSGTANFTSAFVPAFGYAVAGSSTATSIASQSTTDTSHAVVNIAAGNIPGTLTLTDQKNAGAYIATLAVTVMTTGTDQLGTVTTTTIAVQGGAASTPAGSVTHRWAYNTSAANTIVASTLIAGQTTAALAWTPSAPVTSAAPVYLVHEVSDGVTTLTQVIAAQLKAPTIYVLVLGDNLLARHGNTGTLATEQYLAQYLQALAGNRAIVPFYAAQGAVSASYFAQGAQGYTNAVAAATSTPNYVVEMTGFNDADPLNPAANVKTAMQSTIAGMVGTSGLWPNAKFLILQPPDFQVGPYFLNPASLPLLESYRTLVYPVLADNKTVFLADPNALWASVLRSHPEWYENDFIYCNDAGCSAAGSTFAALLAPYLGLTPAPSAPSAQAAPLTLTATAGVNSEVLTWTADSGATNGYEVDWKPSSVLPVAGQVKSIVAIVGPGTLTWTDTSAYRLAQSGRYNVVGLH